MAALLLMIKNTKNTGKEKTSDKTQGTKELGYLEITQCEGRTRQGQMQTEGLNTRGEIRAE